MRRAVVLFNLGGPDSLEAVRPFLFNLFNDPAIFHLPQPFRSWLAAVVAKRRAPVAVEIYRHLGGGSPLLANTEDQARALQAGLGGLGQPVSNGLTQPQSVFGNPGAGGANPGFGGAVTPTTPPQPPNQ